MAGESFRLLLEGGLLVVTGLLALYTGRLFKATQDVARRTHELAETTNKVTTEVARRTQELAEATLLTAKVADRHHQEALLPYIVYEGSLIKQPDPGGGGHVGVNGSLVNVGPGMALEVTLSLALGESLAMGALAPGQRQNVKYVVPVVPGGRPVNVIPLKLTIIYKNLFKSPSMTEHLELPDGGYNTVYTPPQVVHRELD